METTHLRGRALKNLTSLKNMNDFKSDAMLDFTARSLREIAGRVVAQLSLRWRRRAAEVAQGCRVIPLCEP